MSFIYTAGNDTSRLLLNKNKNVRNIDCIYNHNIIIDQTVQNY